MKMSYRELEMKVVQWGEARRIVQNSTPAAQWKKTLEEVMELRDAIDAGDLDAMKDAYGDILVTLIMGCATADIDLVSCLELAYNEIKNRKGYLTPDGIFVKEV
jgi:NTP pyrophosphatase (non-canonical NTP hydrolase)